MLLNTASSYTVNNKPNYIKESDLCCSLFYLDKYYVDKKIISEVFSVYRNEYVTRREKVEKVHLVEVVDINNKLVSFDEVYGEYKSECFCLALNSDFEQHIVVEGDRDCVLRFTDKIKSLVFDKDLQ